MYLEHNLISGTESKHIEPMRRTKKSKSKKNQIIISHTLEYNKIKIWLQLCSDKGFMYFQVFIVLEALYI